MPDRRQHRGPHPQDQQLFDRSAEPILREATGELSWLLSRGYAIPSSLKLVGDRHQLTARQRLAVSRCACSDQSLAIRQQHRAELTDLRGGELWIDGYNVLTSVEAALAGGVIMHARDGCFRDMASMHGSYRKVQETVPAILKIGEQLARWNIARCRWLLDRPVSNSGRLRALLEEQSQQHDWNWQVELVPDPDPILCRCNGIVGSADSQILEGADRWFNLAREIIETLASGVWVIQLSTEV